MNETDERPIDRVIAALEARCVRYQRCGPNLYAQCLAHDDRKPSVSITDAGDIVLIKCHGDRGCTFADVIEAYGLSAADLRDGPGGVRTAGEFVTEYVYTDAAGQVVGCVQRYQDPDTGKKTFRQWSWVDGAWEAHGCPALNVALYRELEMRAGQAAGREAYIVAGEKDVNTAYSLGLIATCHPGGEGKGKFKTEHAERFQDRSVHLIRDADATGRAYSTEVVGKLRAVGARVRVWEAAPPHKDLTEHVAAGRTLAELIDVTTEALHPGRRLEAVSASSVKPRRQRWLWSGRVPLKAFTLLAGREGIGKSTVAVKVTAEVTRGELYGEMNGRPASVLYLTSEDSRAEVIVPRLMAAGADLDRVHFVDAFDNGAPSRASLPLDVDALEALIGRLGVVLIVLDAATSVIDGKLDGDRDRQMRQGLEPIAHLADRTGTAVIGIVHFGKKESGDTGKLILGSIAWSQVARSVLAVAADEDGKIVVSTTKANLAPSGTANLSAEIVERSVLTEDGVSLVGVVNWLGETDVSARDLLGGDDAAEERSAQGFAVEWLSEYLTVYGRPRSAEVKKAANAEGIRERTLARARVRLKVVTDTEGFPRTSYWSLPPDSGASLADDVRARSDGTTGTTGPDQGKRDGITGTTEDPRGTTTGTTGSTGSDQEEHDTEPSSRASRAIPHARGTTEDRCTVCGAAGTVPVRGRGRYCHAHIGDVLAAS